MPNLGVGQQEIDDVSIRNHLHNEIVDGRELPGWIRIFGSRTINIQKFPRKYRYEILSAFFLSEARRTCRWVGNETDADSLTAVYCVVRVLTERKFRDVIDAWRE